MCSPEGICEWIGSDVLEHYISAGYKLHENQSRMSYALPSWVPREKKLKPNLKFQIFLDLLKNVQQQVALPGKNFNGPR